MEDKLTIDYVLTRSVDTILPDREALENIMKKRAITLYQGFDPTSPSLHIGHYIGIRKLAQFQKLGHKVIFLIGDFTGMIGDPSDKSAARTKLTREQVLKNMEGYIDQVKGILDFEGDNAAQIIYNSDWLAKLNFEDVLDLASHFTVQQLLERDFFQNRLKAEKPIYLHEFLYPLMQGYDSAVMGVDLEIGGSDQLFNMLAGRPLVKALKGKEKYVLSLKLLADPDGKKMGKTEGNAVNLTDSASEVYGKIMSLPDSFLERGLELLTDHPMELLETENPLDLKKQIAYHTVAQIKGVEEASDAARHFEDTFQKGQVPSDPENLVLSGKDSRQIADVVAKAKSVGSKSQAKRLIAEGAVDVNETTVTDIFSEVADGDIIKLGKKDFIKVEIK